LNSSALFCSLWLVNCVLILIIGLYAGYRKNLKKQGIQIENRLMEIRLNKWDYVGWKYIEENKKPIKVQFD
jgi:hypothetical protein